ncbi:MAG TPA: AAA domain-containing protein, partial [Methanocorpusculum sp.]|nr:AAA domain-containing protein [Methanocorpusculum sp.]
MGGGQWNTGSFGGTFGTAKALDKRGWTLKNIDYFAYYIRRVSENMRNTRYPFRFEQGERIARLLDRSIDISGAEVRMAPESSEPLRQVAYGKFQLADTMPDTGEVVLVRGESRHLVSYEVCGSVIRNVVPLSGTIEDKDQILDLIFHSRLFFISPSDEKDVVFCIEADRDDHSLILSRDRIPVDTLWAIDEGYMIATQRAALKSLSEYAQPHNRPLLNLFEPTDVYDWKRVVPAVVSSDAFVFLNGPRNEAQNIQREAVRKALGTEDFAIIQGPPGSGKTTVLLETIVQAIKAGKRILLVASTHVAVDNILERLESHGCMERFGINPIRIGFEERVSQKINKFRLSVAAEEECKRLLVYYRSIPVEQRTPAQMRMEQLLSDPSAPEEMENVII